MSQKFFTILIFLTLIARICAQELYDLNSVQTIKITFAQSNWDALLDDQKAGNEDYIMAQSISINGVVLDSVGVKYKGNSTYNANQVKNPFHIELDTYKDQDYDSYTDIKLSNVANDPSFLREVLSYNILQKYMDAPLSNYANVYVNGSLIGLYSNSESIGKKFVKSHFYSKKNTFIKCNPPDGANHSTSDIPNLVYLGQDSSDYYDAYELKSDEGWQELINLCDTLQNATSSIENILDVDRTLWMLAFNNVLVNLDSYSGLYTQNYYLYRDDNNLFIPIMWDFNESFGRFSQTGSSNLNSTSSKAKMSHLLHQNDANYPLIKNLLNVPMYKRMYIAHMKTILLENFDNNSYYTTGETLQALINDDVQADNNKFFTYNNFISNLSSDISSGGRPGPTSSSTPGIKSLMDARNNYLLALSDFTSEAPEITTIAFSDSTPQIGDSIIVSISIKNTTNSYFAFRTDEETPFTKLATNDEGTYPDKIANDGIFTCILKIESSLTQYYVYSENDDAGIFSPQRAAHEYFSLTATVSDTGVKDLVINEFMASNASSVSDQNEEYDDWIELYNNSNQNINLEGYYLSDDASDLTQWPFPSGSSISENGYIVVWADKDEEQSGLHANFKLSAAYETIFLVDSEGSIVDEISYADQTTDISYGRFPNGVGSFTNMPQTFNSENAIVLSTTDITKNSDPGFKIFPNPASDMITINISENSNSQKLKIYHISGQLMFEDMVREQQTVNVSEWKNGIYFIKVGTETQKLIVR